MSVWLTPERFAQACNALPLVSIDLYVTRASAHGQELLLGHRNKHPAQGWWFTPGGRIRKNEPLRAAMRRIAAEEIGMENFGPELAQFIGVWDHFYKDSAFDAHVSTHYVNLAYQLSIGDDELTGLNLPVGCEAQHAQWQWMPLDLAAVKDSVHENVRVVVKAMMSELEKSGFRAQQNLAVKS